MIFSALSTNSKNTQKLIDTGFRRCLCKCVCCFYEMCNYGAKKNCIMRWAGIVNTLYFFQGVALGPQPRYAMTVFRTYKQTIASTKAPIDDEIFHLGNSFSRRTKVYTKRDSQQLRTHNTPNVNERYKWVIYILEYYNICIFNKFSLFMIVCESRRACMTFYFKL